MMVHQRLSKGAGVSKSHSHNFLSVFGKYGKGSGEGITNDKTAQRNGLKLSRNRRHSVVPYGREHIVPLPYLAIGCCDWVSLCSCGQGSCCCCLLSRELI